MQTSHTADHSATLPGALFGPPALRRTPPAPPVAPDRPTWRPTVTAAATRTLSMGHDPRAVEVVVDVGGLAFTALVRAGRVCGPMWRGERAVTITDRALAREVTAAVIDAAQIAETAGGAA